VTKAKALPTLDLADVKDDVGMPLTGTENDAWLDRRIAGVMARFEKYTSRYLGAPAEFIDAWSPPRTEQNVLAYWPARDAPVLYLRNFPVVSIVSATSEGVTVDPSSVMFDDASGQLIGYGNPAAPSRFVLPTIQYIAGFQEIPADLYEAMIGILRAMWTGRANEQAGINVGGMTPNKMSIADVGDVGLTATGTGFDEAIAADAKYLDPYLGPYTYLLDSYADLRAALGGALMPRTTRVPAAPPVVP
jgi:hypothetical protein